MRTLFVCFALLLAIGCSDGGPPEDLLPEGQYVNLLVELQLLNNYQQKQRADSTRIDSIRQIIMGEYGTSEQQFQRSHAYYQQQTTEQRKRISQAIENLRQDRIGPDSTASDINNGQAFQRN